MNEAARTHLRPCAATASNPPLSPWYEWYLRDREPIALSADTVPEPGPYKLRLMADQSCCDGDLDAALRDIAAAIDGYQRVADEWGVADALAVKASIARAAGEVDVAAEIYRESLSIFNVLGDLPSTIRLYRALGEARFAAGDYAAVTGLYLEAVSLAPGDPVLLTGLGYAAWYEGRLGDALTFLAETLHVEGDNQPALSALGQIEADAGHPAQALAHLDRALSRIAPGEEEADLRSARALALAHLDRPADAETELTAAFAVSPRRAWSFLRAAQIRLHGGDRAAARPLLVNALAATLPLPPAHAAKARALLEPLEIMGG